MTLLIQLYGAIEYIAIRNTHYTTYTLCNAPLESACACVFYTECDGTVIVGQAVLSSPAAPRAPQYPPQQPPPPVPPPLPLMPRAAGGAGNAAPAGLAPGAPPERTTRCARGCRRPAHCRVGGRGKGEADHVGGCTADDTQACDLHLALTLHTYRGSEPPHVKTSTASQPLVE